MVMDNDRPPRIHRSVTEDRVHALCLRRLHSLDDPGICLGCGAEVDGVEPDARAYQCEHCGKPRVWGCDEVLIAGLFHPNKKV